MYIEDGLVSLLSTPGILQNVHLETCLDFDSSIQSFWFDFFIKNIVNENVIWSSRRIESTALAPIITAGIHKKIALCIEAFTWDLPLNGIKALESLPAVLVPE